MANLLKVMTLNAMHGQGGGIWPLRRKSNVKQNLEKIAGVVSREKPDVALLQEVDRKSFASGYFDHLAAISGLAGYGYSYHGNHVDLKLKNFPLVSYGTAILSQYPIDELYSHKFATRSPLAKGFVCAEVKIPQSERAVNVVSLHLVAMHPTPKKSGMKQACALVEDVSKRLVNKPLILGGDFNCELDSEENGGGTLKYIADNLNLSYRIAESAGSPFCTFPSKCPRKCLDWIMVSRELEIVNCYPLSDKISDHCAVVAEIGVSR